MQTSNTRFISSLVNKSDYFFLDLNPRPRSDLFITCGGIEYCRLDYIVERPHFKFYGLEYIISGKCKLEMDGSIFNLHAGSLFCYSPTTAHRIENTGNTELVKAFIDFAGEDVEKAIPLPFFKNKHPLQMPNLRSMHELFLLILETGKDGGRRAQKILRAILHLIALQVNEKAVRMEEYHSRSYSSYERCLSFLETHYCRINSVSSLADSCHVSTGYLTRIFKKYAEESPSGMLTRLKMNRAGELLLKERLLIKEIADRVGFQDPYHFSRVFKQFHGVSPKSFRRTLPSRIS